MDRRSGRFVRVRAPRAPNAVRRQPCCLREVSLACLAIDPTLLIVSPLPPTSKIVGGADHRADVATIQAAAGMEAAVLPMEVDKDGVARLPEMETKDTEGVACFLQLQFAAVLVRNMKMGSTLVVLLQLHHPSTAIPITLVAIMTGATRAPAICE